MPDKKCPRCGQWNASSALRCDCGYDFRTGIVHESPYRRKPPKSIRYFLTILIVVNAVLLVMAFEKVFGDGFLGALFLLVWSPLVYILYAQLIRKRNWARILLTVLTFPIGLYLLLDPEIGLYMLQVDRPAENSENSGNNEDGESGENSRNSEESENSKNKGNRPLWYFLGFINLIFALPLVVWPVGVVVMILLNDNPYPDSNMLMAQWAFWLYPVVFLLSLFYSQRVYSQHHPTRAFLLALLPVVNLLVILPSLN